MKLMTKKLEAKFVTQGSQEMLKDPFVLAHYFVGNCDWWALEYNPKIRTFFGYVCLGDPEMAELGYFYLDEMEKITVPVTINIVSHGQCPAQKRTVGLSIERDLYWTEKCLSTIIKEVKKNVS